MLIRYDVLKRYLQLHIIGSTNSINQITMIFCNYKISVNRHMFFAEVFRKALDAEMLWR